MNTIIARDYLYDGKVEALLQEHLSTMHRYSPPENVHALKPEQLRDPNVSFWSARQNGELLACGALKDLGNATGEIKSMKTSDAHVRRGYAEQILEAILDAAQQRAYSAVFLETGSHAAFLPALKLYQKHGFKICGPFSDYKEDPHSVFLMKPLGK